MAPAQVQSPRTKTAACIPGWRGFADESELHFFAGVSPLFLLLCGLDADRKRYLFQEIRQFFKPGTEDLVSPSPSNSVREHLKYYHMYSVLYV